MRNSITIEQIDQVLQRVPYATYKDAKEALVITEGDVVEAIIMLETSKSSKGAQAGNILENVENSELVKQIKEMLHKGNTLRLVVEKDGRVIVNLPVTAAVVGVAIGTLATFVGLSAAILGKCTIKLENESEGTFIDLGELTKEKITMLEGAFNSIVKDLGDNAKKVNKKSESDDKDITDELINEEEGNNDNFDILE